MQAADLPTNEQSRLQNLYSYELLDTLPEKDYDEITKLASVICGTPISLVTLIDEDRQWFKSAHGLGLQQTSREVAFCTHAMLKPDETFIVPNARKDERFHDNPLVTEDPYIGFYAGVPLITDEGFPIGSLCVIDHQPKQLDEQQLQSLRILANQTMRLIKLNKKTKELFRNQLVLQEINRELDDFAKNTADHIKNPAESAIELTDIIQEKYSPVVDADGIQLLSLIKYSCEKIRTTVDETLERADRINRLQDAKTLFTFSELVKELKEHLPCAENNIMLDNFSDNENIYYFKNLLVQMLTDITSSSFAFNDKPDPLIHIAFKKSREQYMFWINDNGKGAPVISKGGEFYLLHTNHDEKSSEYLQKLNSVKQAVNVLSGSLEMNFDDGSGTNFVIMLPK